MAKKFVPIISVIIMSALVVLFLYETSSVDRDILSDTFTINAVYLEEEKIVEISFRDNTQKTNSAVLEILGMKDSFQKTFEASSFVERVPFDTVPQYGWKIHPVTFVIDHQELGNIGIKTEIHSENELAPKTIYEIP